jgi:adenine-specific DNA-methyltransferase
LHTAGNLCVTIDDVEMPSLSMIMSKVYGPKNIAGVIAIRANPSGRPNEAGLAIAHEYAIFAKASIDSKIKKLPRTDAQLQRYDEKDETSIFEWRNFRREGSNSNREDGKRQWYPVYANLNDGTIRVPKMEWLDDAELWDIKEKLTKDETEMWPISDDGFEKNWRWSEENVRNDYTQFHARKNNRNMPQIYYKFRPNTDGITPLTFWQEAKYSATEHGTKTLKNLFNHSSFSYPKSIWAVKDCLYIMGNERNSINLDYFPGSGTTFHAVQLLNKGDDGVRKCILIEQGDYNYTIIIPRIKKIAYTFDWKDGKPENGSMNGLGVFFKYQRLEQYEEALENIAFTANKDAQQQALEFDQLHTQIHVGV